MGDSKRIASFGRDRAEPREEEPEQERRTSAVIDVPVVLTLDEAALDAAMAKIRARTAVAVAAGFADAIRAIDGNAEAHEELAAARDAAGENLDQARLDAADTARDIQAQLDAQTGAARFVTSSAVSAAEEELAAARAEAAAGSFGSARRLQAAEQNLVAAKGAEVGGGGRLAETCAGGC